MSRLKLLWLEESPKLLPIRISICSASTHYSFYSFNYLWIISSLLLFRSRKDSVLPVFHEPALRYWEFSCIENADWLVCRTNMFSSFGEKCYLTSLSLVTMKGVFSLLWSNIGFSLLFKSEFRPLFYAPEALLIFSPYS